MIQRQLAEEIAEHELSPADLEFLVEKTAGRSAVNMERLISSAALHAACAQHRHRVTTLESRQLLEQ